MLIVSWNTAGLGTTVQRIDKNYGCNVDAGQKRKHPSSVFKSFIERYQADILCIQESKIPLSQLQSRSEPLQCAHVDGYESFWCPSVCADKKGFNGVVTYARTGTVVSANARPFNCPELDDQGRCVMTDHGSFVVFNVYAPAGGGNPMSYKMKFLRALRHAMQDQRTQEGKHVVLVGDLNISHTKDDIFWASRRLDVNAICREVHDAATAAAAASSNSTTQLKVLPQWKSDLAKAWPTIVTALNTKTAVEVTTTNPRTGDTFQKYRLAVTLQVDNGNTSNSTTAGSNNNTNQTNGGGSSTKQIYLGKHEESPGHCYYYFDFENDYYTDADTGEQILVCDENLVPVATMAELMVKIVGVEWDEQSQRRIAAEDGVTNPSSPPRRWLDEGIIKQDGMIDTFRHFYPTAEGRFTIWDQFRNRRYSNEGARIDFCLIDKALRPYLQKGGGNDCSKSLLRCGCLEDRDRHDPNSEEAALCAATCGGKYVAVSFEGGGIVEASQTTLEHCSHFGSPHTGMIYSPPSLSDHIPVSVLLDDSIDGQFVSRKLVLRANEKSVREAQPHKKQPTIKDIFFAASTGSSSASSSTSNANQSSKRAIATTKQTLKRKGPMSNFLTATTNNKTENDGAGMDRQNTPSKATKTIRSTSNNKSNGKRLAKGSKGHPSVLGFFQKKSS